MGQQDTISVFGEEIMSPTQDSISNQVGKTPTEEWVVLENDIHNFLETVKTQIKK
jgi:hypothetical protein